MPARARELAEQLHELNDERQQAEAEVSSRSCEECARSPVSELSAALVFCGGELASRRAGHRGQPRWWSDFTARCSC